MSDPPGISPSKFYHLFIRKPYNTGNTKVIRSNYSIWEYDNIERLENNQWKCLWCNIIFQGNNVTKALAHVIGTKLVHIKLFLSSIYQAHLSKYKD